MISLVFFAGLGLGGVYARAHVRRLYERHLKQADDKARSIKSSLLSFRTFRLMSTRLGWYTLFCLLGWHAMRLGWPLFLAGVIGFMISFWLVVISSAKGQA